MRKAPGNLVILAAADVSLGTRIEYDGAVYESRSGDLWGRSNKGRHWACLSGEARGLTRDGNRHLVYSPDGAKMEAGT